MRDEDYGRYPREDPSIERLAWLLDRWIRIGPFSIGLDGLLGLIPGLGDITGTALSALIIAKAMQAGVPRIVILRMVANVGIDSLLGSIPFIGDIFDFAYKSNIKNLALYRQAMLGARRPVRDWGFIVLIGVLVLACIALPIIGLVYLARLAGPYIPAF
jgi:hypothetical protein